jgi:dethiobiotin synthetase
MKNSTKGLFVTGIDTNIGKTLASAIIKEAFEADYWKPIQCGDLNKSDSLTVENLTKKKGTIHPETFSLQHPLSPHQAAAKEGKNIQVSNFDLPQTDNILVVEGAGGLLVPLNQKETILDLISSFNLPVIIVTKNYLGSLNHTLLTIETLKRNHLKILGIIFNGQKNQELEKFLCLKSGLPNILNIQEEESISKETIKKYSSKLLKKGVLNDFIKTRQRTHLAPLHTGTPCT